MKSMDELREEIRILKQDHIDTDELVRIADAIEREVEEGHIGLPRDKNGVPIRLGDRVCSAHGGTYEVARITREDYNGTTTWYIEDFASNFSLGPEDLTHHKPPTVEDVLENALNEAAMLDRKEGYWPSAADITNIVNKLAPKLQLRGEKDE